MDEDVGQAIGLARFSIGDANLCWSDAQVQWQGCTA
jgi:hypothetical protein